MIMMFIIIIIIVIVCTFHGYLKVLVRMKHGGGTYLIGYYTSMSNVNIGILRVKKLNMFL